MTCKPSFSQQQTGFKHFQSLTEIEKHNELEWRDRKLENKRQIDLKMRGLETAAILLALTYRIQG